jgi:hypothetical protein
MADNDFPEWIRVNLNIYKYKDEIQNEQRLKDALHRFESGRINFDTTDSEEPNEKVIRLSLNGYSYNNILITEDIKRISKENNLDTQELIRIIFKEIYTNWQIYNLDRTEDIKNGK